MNILNILSTFVGRFHQQKWTRSKIGTLDPYLTPLNTSECNEIRWGIHLASVGGAQGVTDQ